MGDFRPSVIIIGSGMAGLSAGCYAQMNGFTSRIFEQNEYSGGVCTSWQKDRYTVNGCIHWLVGSSPTNSFHQVWQELGAIDGQSFMDHDRFFTFESKSGQTLTLFTDVDCLEQHLLEIAPEDTKEIQNLIQAIQSIARCDYSPTLHEGFQAWLENIRKAFTHLPLFRVIMKWGLVSIRDYADRLRSPVLKEALLHFWHPEMSMIILLMTLAFAHRRTAGYPLGGSSTWIQRIADRYSDLGGSLHLNSRVSKILVKEQENEAYGIRLASGEEYYAEYIISAADAHHTIYQILEGNYQDERITAPFEQLKLFPPILFVSFGVNCPFEDVPASVVGLSFPLEQVISVGEESVDRLTFQIYNFDPELAPVGKTVLTCMVGTEYDYWYDLYQHPVAYQAKKEEILNQMIRALEQRFPSISGQIEMKDLATPMTYYRYSSNFRASYEGWLPTPRALRTKIKHTLPGLSRFYQIGHWTEPGGGLPPSALSGRKVIQKICHRERLSFQTSKPHDKEALVI